MDRLPKAQAKVLREIAPHSGESFYFKKRYAGMSFEDARNDFLAIKSLERHGMISCVDLTFPIEIEQPDQVGEEYVDGRTILKAVTGFDCPVEFYLTADGRDYDKERRTDRIAAVAGVVVTAVLSGFFAWVFTLVSSS